MIELDKSTDASEHAKALDAAGLLRLATGYLTRYAASTHRLRRVLARKIRRWHDLRALPQPSAAAATELVEATLARVVELGLVDDDAVTLARARGLVRKGLPGEQVRRRLAAEGLDGRMATLDDVIVEDAATQARRYAARKSLGPFRTGAREAYRDKDIRSLVRAGFPYRDAVATIDGSADEGG